MFKIVLDKPGIPQYSARVEHVQFGSEARDCRGEQMNSAEETKSTKTAKGEQTKALILNSALELLRDLGYEKTTMRAIARKPGVSLGNAYHYFGAKDHLIQAVHQRTHQKHLAASLPVLKKERS